MVEEVVPFAEVLAAVVVIAFENLDVPFAFWVFEAEDPEPFGSRDVFLDLDGAKVERLASLHVHCHVIRNVIEGVTVLLQ